MTAKWKYVQNRALVAVLVLMLSAVALGEDATIRLSSPVAVDGSMIVVTVEVPAGLTGIDEKDLEGYFHEYKFPFFKDGEGKYSGIFGVPHNFKIGHYPIKVQLRGTAGARWMETDLEVTDGKYASEKLRVDPRRVKPKKKDLERIYREIAEVGKLYSKISRTKHWLGPFDYPIKSPITSVYGTKRVFNGEFQSYHSGLDLRAPVGTNVFAPAPGVVVLTKDLFFSGKTVIIDHGYGLLTLYAHLSKMKVKKGQLVKTGDLLALSGSTGRVSGPHLHWQVIANRVKVNPMGLLEVLK